MKLGRVLYLGKIYDARLLPEEGVAIALASPPLAAPAMETNFRIPLAEAEVLPPVLPGKVVCVGLNYRDHAEEFKQAAPEEPLIFLKPPSSVIGPGQAIRWPRTAGRVDYEAELALVIGGKACRISEAESRERVFGYTCANDVTARQLQKKDGQWTRAKGFDTFCPLGPWIVRGFPPDSVQVEMRRNGKKQQSSNASKMIFPPARLVSFISSVMTLEPGDVVLTGTPSGVGPIESGDILEVEIEGVGILKNPVEGPF